MWWRRLRWSNLAMMAGLIILLYAKFIHEGAVFPFLLVVLHTLAICMIAGGAYLHNDLVDQVSDRINRGVPEDTKVTHQLVRASSYLSSLGIGVAVFHGMLSGSYALSILVCIVVIMLYCYSRWLQSLPLWGNLVVSTACALVIVSVPLSHSELWHYKTILVGLSLFAFLITLARELVKDLEDVPGDQAAGQRTLAIIKPEAARLLALICMILTVALLIWSVFLLPEYQTLGSKVMACILIPIAVFLCLRIRSTTQTLGWKLLSLWLKMFMLLGFLLVFFYYLP